VVAGDDPRAEVARVVGPTTKAAVMNDPCIGHVAWGVISMSAMF
jgi:hypothetical protein